MMVCSAYRAVVPAANRRTLPELRHVTSRNCRQVQRRARGCQNRMLGKENSFRSGKGGRTSLCRGTWLTGRKESGFTGGGGAGGPPAPSLPGSSASSGCCPRRSIAARALSRPAAGAGAAAAALPTSARICDGGEVVRKSGVAWPGLWLTLLLVVGGGRPGPNGLARWWTSACRLVRSFFSPSELVKCTCHTRI